MLLPEQDEVSNIRGKIVEVAKSLTGIRYKYGGLDIDGFDCSGLVHYVYNCFGIELPHSSKTLSRLRDKVNLSEIKPADILIFKLGRRWHSALYIADDLFIHAPSRGEKVRTEGLNEYWKKRFKCALRILPE